MRKIETFSCKAEVSSVRSPSASASEDSEKIPIACPHREDAVASPGPAPTEDFSEKIRKKNAFARGYFRICPQTIE